MKKIFFLILVLSVYCFGHKLDGFHKACEGGDYNVCAMLGYMYIQDNNVTNARIFFEKACDGKVAEGCNNLGVMYEYGEGIKKDNKKAKAFYKKACDWKYQKGCENLKALNEDKNAS